MSFKNEIKKYMELKEVSYSQLSKLTGISKSSLQRYATGTTNKIPIEAIEKIENSLSLKKGTLMGWSDETFVFSDDEKQVITAYREQPPMQEAVKRLLGIDN